MGTRGRAGGIIFSAVILAVFGIFVLFAKSEVRVSLADDVLVLAENNLHPVEVFSVPEPARSVKEAFEMAGVPYFSEDKVTAFPDPSLGLGTVITVARALPVNLVDGRRSLTVRTWAESVGELIAEKKIILGEDDRVAPALETRLGLRDRITITRVAITQIVENEAVNFKIVKKNDPNLDEGKTRVERPGVRGTRAYTYRVRREDGIEVERVLLKNELTKPPTDEILIVGTKPVITVRCRYNDWVLDAGIKNGVRPNELCNRMMAESNGNSNSVGAGGRYKGLFQYEEGFWNSVSVKAGYGGASIWDARSQIYVTAWAWVHDYRGRWPNP